MAANQKPDDIYAMRHSLAHVMAQAVQRLWPEAKFGVGPVVENGFYYDIDLGETKISEQDFAKIEKTMRRIIAEKQEFVRSTKPIDEAIDWAKQANQPYKLELLNDLKRAGTTVAKDLDADEMGTIAGDDSALDEASFYTNGDFTDLCRGPHVANTGEVGAFKLMRVAGAYWRGKEGNPQMQRVYGVAFADEQQLKTYLQTIEEAKKRDHRKLGKDLDLFTFSDLVGSGLPLFTPRGTVLREELGRFTQELRENAGFQRIWTPVIAKNELYKASGHWDKFGDELFLVKSQETSDEFVLRPMNCPHHIQIYASQPRSYRDMPIKFMENAGDYRDEKTGELHGLSRVRSFTQDDSHAFVRNDQIKQVASELVAAATHLYKVLGMNLAFRLSFRDDGEGYLGDLAVWNSAQQQIEELAKENDLDYYIEEGEAAFYGPKIDFMATDAIGRQWQVATVQLDFVQPERFGLEYVDDDGQMKQPVMLHCALLGSLERFLSVYIEHTAGKFPVWCAPEQVRLLSVNQEPATVAFVEELQRRGRQLGLRIAADNSNESVGKKIRSAELWKVPYALVIGEKEVGGGELTPRIRKDLVVHDDARSYTAEELLKTIANEAKSRVSKTSL
ncbi:threonine--tRNA ligase [Candidatus Saccharibacteria bacterium]|nr:MAG: threonine--tRNA ligase [Candidatus Saccharibacteria bacterium]PID98873.1 MAG: threonine--tRNA ligase [Candidatus Saccharibacteria bacterium]